MKRALSAERDMEIRTRPMSAKKPFTGITFSSTSVPSDVKSDVVKRIRSMGGEYSNDLMSDTTVLVVGDRETEKYRFCVRRRYDVLFVRPSAIKTLHEKWMAGEDGVELADYTMAVFDGLSVCLSRMDEQLKTKLQQLVTSNGGATSESLTMGSSCIVGLERSGKRYEKAIEWKIPVVHPSWVEDCIRRRATLDMQYYEIDKVDERSLGKDACLVWDQLGTVVARKDPVVDDAGLKIKKKAPHLWTGIMGELKSQPRSSSKAGTWDEQEREATGPVETAPVEEPAKPERRLFDGYKFAIESFSSEQHRMLEKVLTSNGASVGQSGDSDTTHILVPSTVPLSEYQGPRNLPLVTEWFIERSLHYGEIRNDRWGQPLVRSIAAQRVGISISGFSGIELLHMTKLIAHIGCEFHETFRKERDWLVVNIAGLGIPPESPLFHYRFREVLDIPPPSSASAMSTKAKISAAKKWGVHVVSPAFVWEWAETGERPAENNPEWTVYCPPEQSLESAGAIGYATDTSEGLEHAKLPSPSKRKRSWGRIVGKAPESQLSADSAGDSFNPFMEPLEEVRLTQISYGDEPKRRRNMH